MKNILKGLALVGCLIILPACNCRKTEENREVTVIPTAPPVESPSPKIEPMPAPVEPAGEIPK